jgi:hypothetical protein
MLFGLIINCLYSFFCIQLSRHRCRRRHVGDKRRMDGLCWTSIRWSKCTYSCCNLTKLSCVLCSHIILHLLPHLQAHVIDIKNKAIWATGVFTNGGFEKIYELNSQHPDFVIFGVSGYNGDFGPNTQTTLDRRKALFNLTGYGNPYVWTDNIHPFRVYVGRKGKLENGQDAPASDFLARNGLKYGKMYGFAIDMSVTGPTKGMYRDAFHLSADANNGAKVPGAFVAQNWSWDGQVKNFEFDGSWDYQNPTGVNNWTWWNAGGINRGGFKCEHGSPVCCIRVLTLLRHPF